MSRLIHSKYDPVKEARNQLESFVEIIETKLSYVVFGVGMGYHLYELMKYLPKESKMYLLEPSIGALNLFFENGGETLLNDSRLQFYLINVGNASEIAAEIINMDNCDSFYFFAHPVYANIYTKAHDIFVKSVNKLSNNYLVQKLSILQFGENWCANSILNTKHILNAAPVNALFGLFSGMDFIVVAAGPSLSRNIKELKRAKGKAVIICVDTAYKALYYNKIEPDIVVSVSGSNSAHKKLEGVRCNVPLVFKAQTSNGIVNCHNGIKFYSMYISGCIDIFFEALNIDAGYLESGGSVMCTAIDLALKMGAKKIIFVGLDLALTGNESHAKNTTGRLLEGDKKFIVETTDIFGNVVMTLKNFLQYKRWIEEFIDNNTENVSFIDATEGGAVINGAAILPFGKVLEQLPNKTTCFSEKIRDAFVALADSQCKQFIINKYADSAAKMECSVQSLDSLIKLYEKGEAITPAHINNFFYAIIDNADIIKYAVMAYYFKIGNLRIGKDSDKEYAIFKKFKDSLEQFQCILAEILRALSAS